MNIIGRRRLWYTISLAILVPATLVLIIFGLKLGIDFKGGAVLTVSGNTTAGDLGALAAKAGVEDASVTTGGEGQWVLHYRLVESVPNQEANFEASLKQAGLAVVSLDQVGPSVSRDLIKNAFKAIAFMSLAIVIYITIVFRKVPKGVSAWSFGLATLGAAFLHDALFVLGAYAIFGKIFGIEVDTYIVTAILTVIGFSIHDTVVVFDRIREKLAAGGMGDFAKTVNDSINETLVRSLNTSLVIVLVLLALFLFGGASTHHFILALLLGMVSGTYSSIFIAAPLLVTWQQHAQKRAAAKVNRPKKVSKQRRLHFLKRSKQS